ncbi:MAG: matrixin family metalloprotease [Minisyncoccia bacterium]
MEDSHKIHRRADLLKKFEKGAYYFMLTFVIVFVVYSVTTETVWWQKVQNRFSPVSCVAPIMYRIDKIDERFNLEREELESLVTEASEYWNDGFSKYILFASSTESNAITINMVYDLRQEATHTLQVLDTNISENKVVYDALKNQYSTKKDVYDSLMVEYNNLVANYEKKLNEYTTGVEYWNARGGAPEAEFKKYENLKSEISDMSKIVSSKLRVLNSLVDELNLLGEKIQKEAVAVNKDIENYNNSGLVGKEFEQGLYSSRGFTKEINIYQFDSKEKLLNIIKHELGHALGIEHNLDVNSIMHKINLDTAKNILPDDLKQIVVNCRQQDRIDIVLDWVQAILK